MVVKVVVVRIREVVVVVRKRKVVVVVRQREVVVVARAGGRLKSGSSS